MVAIIGAGPAGAAAAIAARQHGASVAVREKSRFPRHKVCGEFLTPEILPLLDRLGVLGAFQDLRPARMDRFVLHLPRRECSAALAEPALGLSRYAFDDLLFSRVEASPDDEPPVPAPIVVASGRPAAKQSRGQRLFGFKAHFRGPVSDAVELFFVGWRCYVGVNPVENGLTNVCGLAPEDELNRHGFEIDALIHGTPRLAERLSPCQRTMDWIFTGPLQFRRNFSAPTGPGVYTAGDALSFVDPFTGTGIASALLSGISAGRHAALGLPVAGHLAECRRALARPFAVASLFRAILNRGWADRLAPLVPAQWLVRWTRPVVVG